MGALRRYGGAQPYRGRYSLCPMGALSPIGGAVRSVLLGALRRYGAAQPYRGRCGAMGPFSPIRALKRYGALRRYGAA